MESETKFKVGDVIVPTEQDAKRVNEHWDSCFKAEHGDAPFYYVVGIDGDTVELSNVKDGLWLVSWLARRFEPWKPKVGDRVRFTDKCDKHWWFGPHTRHKEGVIVGSTSWDGFGEGVEFDVNVDGEGTGHVALEQIEPLPVVAQAQPAATPAPLQIQAGGFYKTRDGRKVGPMKASSWGGFYDESRSITAQRWEKDGSYIAGQTTQLDLIAEWLDDPAAPAATEAASNDNAEPATPKFKVGDRVVCRNYLSDGEDCYGTVSDVSVDGRRVYADDWTVGDPSGYLSADELVIVNPAHPTHTNLTINVASLADLDAVIAKLKKIRKLQRQIAA